MIKISVRHNLDKVARDLERLGGDVDKAVVMAINKTADKGKAEMTRAIAAEFKIPAHEVRGQLHVQKAYARKNILRAVLEVVPTQGKGRSLNLIRFLERSVSLAEARRRAKKGTLAQLGFRIKTAGGVKQIKGAFVGNKGRTVFAREGKDRTPIKALSTIGVPQMFNTKRVSSRVVRRIVEEFPVEFGRATRLILERRRG